MQTHIWLLLCTDTDTLKHSHSNTLLIDDNSHYKQQHTHTHETQLLNDKSRPIGATIMNSLYVYIIYRIVVTNTHTHTVE